MSNWRNYVSPLPPYEEAEELLKSMEKGRKPTLEKLAEVFWCAWLDHTGEKPQVPWEVLVRIVNLGWADPGEVNRRTELVWQHMDEVADTIRGIRAKGSLTKKDLDTLDELIKSPPCWVSVTSRIPTINIEKGDRPVKHE